MTPMSATEVIAEALAEHKAIKIPRPDAPRQCPNHVACQRCDWISRECGEVDPWDEHRLHQASVIAALPNIAVVPRKGIVRIYRAASSLGQQYMMPTHFGADLEEAERWFALQQKMLDGLPGVDTVRLEYQDMWVTKWEPLDVASVAGGEQ